MILSAIMFSVQIAGCKHFLRLQTVLLKAGSGVLVAEIKETGLTELTCVVILRHEASQHNLQEDPALANSFGRGARLKQCVTLSGSGWDAQNTQELKCLPSRLATIASQEESVKLVAKPCQHLGQPPKQTLGFQASHSNWSPSGVVDWFANVGQKNHTFELIQASKDC